MPAPCAQGWGWGARAEARTLGGDPWPPSPPTQELLSHSADRPERQQLKEALEAMQVGGDLGRERPGGMRVAHVQPS